MVSKRLIDLIEKHEEDLTSRWVKKVTSHPDTLTYHNFPTHQLRERVDGLYMQLTQWIGDNLTTAEIERAYLELGAERYREGFRLHEVIRAIMLAQLNLRVYVREQAIFDLASELHQLVELDDSVEHFFDLAVFYTVKGYELALLADRKKG